MQRRNRYGFSFIELIVLLAVLGTLLSISTYIIVRSNAATKQANAAKLTTDRFDSMTDLLRRDVWGASSISAADVSSVQLTIGKKTIAWTFSKGRVTRSEEGELPRKWDGLPAMQFSAERAVLHLRVSDVTESADIDLPSQFLLAGAAR
jgi:type II secretory pathway pseudopilin PulG